MSAARLMFKGYTITVIEINRLIQDVVEAVKPVPGVRALALGGEKNCAARIFRPFTLSLQGRHGWSTLVSPHYIRDL